MSLLEQASTVMHRAGKRMTEQRRLIIRALEDSNAQLDAEGVYDRARRYDNSISLATVYRTLNLLEESGLVQQRYLSREHERKFYELIDTEDEHQVFTCQSCGATIPFTSDLLTDLHHELEATLGVSIAHLCCCVDGLCPACRAAADKPS
jgi:Fur family ferric uptake transcriptional regulator